MTFPYRVAVVGAGIAGLACGRLLQQAGCAVEVFDKSSGCGGRTASHRHEGLCFDHGAQFFTVRDGAFAAMVDEARERGACAIWDVAFQRLIDGDLFEQSSRVRWVGCEGMGGLAKFIGQPLTLHLSTRVTAVIRNQKKWLLEDGDGRRLGQFDAVAIAVPAPQASPLLAETPELATAAGEARLAPCWAVMAVLRARFSWSVDAVASEHPMLAWAARNASKPGRPVTPDTWVLHATPEWSEANIERPAAGVTTALFGAFLDLADSDAEPVHLLAHCWRYARVVRALDQECLVDTNLLIGACGDWCLGPRMESAFLSGQALARRFISALDLSPQADGSGRAH